MASRRALLLFDVRSLWETELPPTPPIDRRASIGRDAVKAAWMRGLLRSV